MPVRVTIDGVVWGDPRYEKLGVLLGTNRYEAIGRMAHLWAWCTERGTDTVSETDCAVFLGTSDNAVTVLVEAGLAEVVEDGVRVRGCEGRIEWLQNLREGGKKGGRTRAKTARRVNGRFAANLPNPNQTRPGVSLEEDQASTRPKPDLSSPITMTITPTITNNNNVADKPTPYTRCIAYYYERYEEQSGGRKPRWSGRAGKSLNGLLSSHGEEEVMARMAYMFDGHSWLKPPYTLGSLMANWDALIPAKDTSTVSGDDLRELAARLKEQGE